MTTGMAYDSGTFGNVVTDNDKPVVVIPDDSVLFNPDWTWNKAKVRELINVLTGVLVSDEKA